MQKLDHLRLGFQVAEQEANALEVLDGGQVFQQIPFPAHDEAAFGALQTGPARQSCVDHPGGEFVELDLRGAPCGLDLGARLGKGPSPETGVEVVRRLDERRGGQAGRHAHDAVLDRAVFRDQNRERAGLVQPHEFEVLQPRVILGGHHDPGAPRQTGQKGGGFGQHALERLRPGGGLHLAVDAPPLAFGQIAPFEQGIHEEAQAEVSRQPACAGVRRIYEAEFFELLHHVANRGRRKGRRQQARQVAGADRFARDEIGVDDPLEDVLRALVKADQGCFGRQVAPGIEKRRHHQRMRPCPERCKGQIRSGQERQHGLELPRERRHWILAVDCGLQPLEARVDDGVGALDEFAPVKVLGLLRANGDQGDGEAEHQA